MSGFNIHSGGSRPDDVEPGVKLESLLAQLRRQSAPDHSPSPDPGASSGPDIPDLLSHFNSFTHGGRSFYLGAGTSESPRTNSSFPPVLDSPAFPPAVPTPPVHNSSHSQFPPGMMNGLGGARDSGNERTANLLNLLKFSGSGGHSNLQHVAREPSINFSPSQNPLSIIHAPAPSAADPSGLLAALMKGHTQSESAKHEPSPPPAWNSTSPPSDTQQYLLNLLNRPKPSQNDAPLSNDESQLVATGPLAAIEKDKSVDPTPVGSSAEPISLPSVPSRSDFSFEPKNFDSPPSFEVSPHPQQAPVSKPGSLGYSNPFEDHSGPSPANRTPQSTATAGPSSGLAGLPVHVPKSDSTQSGGDIERAPSDRNLSCLHTTDSARHKHEQGAPYLSHTGGQHLAPTRKEPGADPVGNLAEKLDAEAQDAIVRAEEEIIERAHDEQEQEINDEIAHNLEDMMNAKTEREFIPSAQVAAQTIQKQLNKEENKTVLENTLQPGVAEEVISILEDAALTSQGPVADSWESAEADEIVVIEETPTTPVKVYSLPMKPWISISVQDITKPRAVFRDEVILDIARLKKDFDQVDRNLVTASEAFLAYGMSRAGGLRVIRQEDGRDARLFTDTKDRIFNTAISSSAPNQSPREAIIGTGVSGTVYWVQLRNGDRDHMEDPNPEQYGFALPPVSAQEGDAPGGVLKTRARTSSTHPEYFAVGRGKSINIIWPSFIFEHNLFKTGYDRVVDTEKLLKHCSLKINTGKAGKDFTFSQDDTLIVSLDKAGRVKFWDVRDLTATKKDSDANPMPARLSLEVKEPLMTVTTTPDNEKAWPTSVLLLDKYRPYQKNSALRYMVVGMKQNHTLQLWDLALGKAVQEFNFPHIKESDAVCSVMYHAPSSMIVVGHPTRNSIYFLHLSAPKYTLKNLSQVDYIQKLVAQDSSIPQPESTAVISGIREYSFANKGVLRSLNILENPTSHGDGDDSTLFELYAMHSKGVTCLFIKQVELGWSRENKVLNGEDAVEAGLVKISKLIAASSPQQHMSETNVPLEASATPASSGPQIRVASRNAKDLQKTPSLQAEEKKGPESTTPPKLAERNKDDVFETPVQQPEKAEKKSRKKKTASVAAAAAVAERDLISAINGHTDLSRTSSQNKPAGGANSKANRPVTDLPILMPISQMSPYADPSIGASDHFEHLIISNLNNLASMEGRIISRLSSHVDSELTKLNQQIQDLQTSRDKEFMEHQANLLEVVSQVLNENTEAVLKTLVNDQFENVVKPHISDQHFLVAQKVNANIIQTLKQDLHHALPTTVNQALQKPEVVKIISERVTGSIVSQLDAYTVKSLNMSVSNILPKAVSTAMQQLGKGIQQQVQERQEQMEHYQRSHDTKIDILVSQMSELAGVVSSMATVQAQSQKDLSLLKQYIRDSNSQVASQVPNQGQLPMQSQVGPAYNHISSQGSVQSRGSVGITTSSPRDVVAYQHHQQSSSQDAYFTRGRRDSRDKIGLDPAAEAIDALMRVRRFDDAMIRWLQSGDKSEEIFSRVIAKYSASFMTELQPLILLSVATTISENLDLQQGAHKLAMIEMSIYHFQNLLPALDDQVREVAPKIMNLLKTRIEQMFLKVSRVAPSDPSLRNLTSMANMAGRIAEAARSPPKSYNSPY